MDTSTQNLLILLSMAGYAFMEWATRRYRDMVHATANDTRLELFMFLSLLAVAQPLALGLSGRLCGWLMPEARGAWASLPWWAMVGILLVADDFTQYLWHRASHTPLLWPLHRAHHTASCMSIRISYRNNFFYCLMMPGLWIGGVLLYLGFGAVYAAYVVVKLTVILGAHCAWRWHVLLGTAHITRRYPDQVGLQGDRVHGAGHWAHQMFYPLLQSQREGSALRFGGRASAADEARGDAAGARQPAA